VDDEVWLVAGLGNPGASYAETRHNLGYRVADLLAERMTGSWRSHRGRLADVVEGRLGGHSDPRVVLAKARSYMNEAGGPISALMRFYKIPTEQLVAIHDELDLPFGTLRVKFGGGDNGHNGLRSLRRSLGTGEFHRVRLGIGRPPGRRDPADFVLSNFTHAERVDVPMAVDRAADAVESLLAAGLSITQSRFNS
jgi:peptidyl-tRNA hydrolase, PTH1 family